MMFPRSRLAIKFLEPLLERRCPNLTKLDWALHGAIIATLVAGAYGMNWLMTGHL